MHGSSDPKALLMLYQTNVTYTPVFEEARAVSHSTWA